MDGVRPTAPIADGHAVEAREGTKTDFSPFSPGHPDRSLPGELLTNSRTRRRWTPEQKQQIVLAALRSGMSLERFSRVSGLTPSVVHRWKHELAARLQQEHMALPVPPTVPSFAAVHVGPAEPDLPLADPVDRTASTADMIEVMLGNGRRLRCHVQIEAAALHRLVMALEQGR